VLELEELFALDAGLKEQLGPEPDLSGAIAAVHPQGAGLLSRPIARRMGG
jgi:hypothetical protein